MEHCGSVAASLWEIPLDRQSNLGDGRQGGMRNCFQGFQPRADGHAQRCNPNASKGFRIPVEAAVGGAEEGDRSCAVAALKMMEGSGDLDQSLQKRFLRFLCREPDQFPVFVGFKERAGMKTTQAFVQISLGPVEWHRHEKKVFLAASNVTRVSGPGLQRGTCGKTGDRRD
jgi:hypothetical protein